MKFMTIDTTSFMLSAMQEQTAAGFGTAFVMQSMKDASPVLSVLLLLLVAATWSMRAGALGMASPNSRSRPRNKVCAWARTSELSVERRRPRSTCTSPFQLLSPGMSCKSSLNSSLAPGNISLCSCFMSERLGVSTAASLRASTLWSPFSSAVSRTAAVTLRVRPTMRPSRYALRTRMAASFCFGFKAREPIWLWASGACSWIAARMSPRPASTRTCTTPASASPL
mmetsp:Transcript_10045/g.35029  ORF Transcript_10045/g.35029 Transcript_10045/m.35029 type:complete len:226 (-) Transcript_10045:324-1001(-)